MSPVDAERWQRVSELLEEISLLPRAERAPNFAAACANDSALHEDIATLLGYDESDASLGLLGAPGRVAALWAQSSEEEVAPERIGPWQIVREIGRGGMGVVYLAQRADGQFDQRAAIKLVRGDHEHSGLRRRFLRERQILANLDHPHIARLLDGGLDEQGHPYFAMEYVDGVPLFAHVSEYRCGLEARLHLFLKMCAAVQFAHRQLVVHRDIKPSNVLVTRDGDLKLLDFGIATLVEERARGDETVTRQQAFTPAYAAPEQLRGEAVTTAADVYALGAVLHELLSGRPAYGLAKNASLLDRLRALGDAAGALPSRAVALPPPSGDAQPTMEALPVRALRGDLDVITSKALRAEPERRYSTVEALADDVRRFLEGLPIAARAEDPRYRMGKFLARHRVSVVVAAALVLALLGSLVIALVQARHANEEAARARHQSERAEAVRTFITGVFEQSSPDVNQGESISPHQLLENGEKQLGAGVSTDPSLQADAATLIANLYQEIGDYARADSLLKKALAGTRDPGVPNDVKARVLVGIAQGEDVNGDYDAALVHARDGISILQRDVHDAPETLAQAHETIAHSLLGQGKIPDAIAVARSALDQDGPALAGHNGVIADDWVTLGNALESEGSFAEAKSAYQKGMDLWSSLYGDDSVPVAHVLNDLSVVLINEGDLSGAENALRRSLSIRGRAFGAESRDTLTVKNNLLAIVEAQGRFDEAIAERVRIAQHGEEAGQLEPVDRLASHLILGVDYGEISRFDDALGELDKAIVVLDAMAGPLSPRHFSTLRHKGEVLLQAGRYQDAETTLRQALKIQTAADSSAWLPMALVQLDLGNLLRRRHDYAGAVDLIKPAADALVAKGQKNPPGRSGALAELSEALLDAGNVADARADAESSLAYARQDLPPGNYRLGDSLYAMARVDLAQGLAAEAEKLTREAALVRSPPHASEDLRVLEVQVALENALALQKRDEEAAALRKETEGRLSKSTSPYAKDLLARLSGGVVPAAAPTPPRAAR